MIHDGIVVYDNKMIHDSIVLQYTNKTTTWRILEWNSGQVIAISLPLRDSPEQIVNN